MQKLRFSSRFIWMIIVKWRGFHRTIHKHFDSDLILLPASYRARVISSAVRIASYMHVISKCVQKPYNQVRAINTGILAAIFDDLIDCEKESFENIKKLTLNPVEFEPSSPHQTCARNLYLHLIKNIALWQKEELQTNILALLKAEQFAKQGSDEGWEKRGAYALKIILTMVGVKEEEQNNEAIFCYGKYMQLLDDYEDYDDETDHLNYFRHNPDFDLNLYYINELKPAIGNLFKVPFDTCLLNDFIETYHVFQIGYNKSKYKKMGPVFRFRKKFTHWGLKILNGFYPF
jgi:hypothetical protein